MKHAALVVQHGTCKCGTIDDSEYLPDQGGYLRSPLPWPGEPGKQLGVRLGLSLELTA